MATTRTRLESGASRSCLDVLAASGYVWGVMGEEHTDNRVARDDDSTRDFDALNVMSLCLFARH